MKTRNTEPIRWKQFVSGLIMIAVASLAGVALTGCGSDDDAAPPAAIVAAPDAPTGLTATPSENLVDLSWSPPAASVTAGVPTSYGIYVSTTDTTVDTVFVPANLLATIPVVDNRTVYNFANSGLEGQTDYYYVVSAKNSGGETPSVLASARPTGSPKPPTAGNNFSAAMIFADNIGISNQIITGTWTLDPHSVDFDPNTGLRPLATEIAAITTLPYLVVPSTVDPLYFEQKTVNTWQGEWAKANGVPVNVNAKWGDNLAGSASLHANAKIRLEMVLTTTVTTPMTTYEMKSLYGARRNEMLGTNGVVIPSTTAFVFASNARLKIEKLENGVYVLVDDQYLFDGSVPDGLNKLAGEIPVSGNFTYGYVWSPSTGAGTYRITFLLDPVSQGGAGNPVNNTFIQSATNGVLVSPTEVYIDIDVR